jgi:hypothetical protein
MGLPSTQLATPIQCDIFRTHGQPGTECAAFGIEGINFLPDGNK